jgi:4-alpha-glucanotransferase
MDINKSSGLILHPSSLPGEYGIGELGSTCFEFIDLLKTSNTRIWQVLPLGITDEVEYSPYSSKSSILGNPYLISLNELENKIIDKNILNELKKLSVSEVEFKNVYSQKQKLFQSISKKIDINDSVYSKFLESNDLIKKHITFVTLSEAIGTNWTKWDKDYLNYSEDTLQKVSEKYKYIFAKNVFLQYEFNTQWKKLKKYANLNNVSILGDIPIYVNHNSADVWLNKALFDLDENNQMGYVSGAVPDDFTVEGQIWNTALYDWEKHAETNYLYWIDKLNAKFK